MRIKSLGFEYEVRVTGPEEYESRTMKFSAWADLATEGVDVTVSDPAQVPAAENAVDARQAAADLCGFVKGVLADEMKPYLEYRAALRASHFREVRDGLPKHLRQYLAPETVGVAVAESGGNGNGKE